MSPVVYVIREVQVVSPVALAAGGWLRRLPLSLPDVSTGPLLFSESCNCIYRY